MANQEAMNARLSSERFLVPQGGDKVFKDECVYSFHSPISDGGLYVCLSTLFGVSSTYLPLHVKRTGKTVFLHLKKVEKPVEEKDDSPPEKKPTKLAIGVEGGFDVDQNKIEYEDHNSLVITNTSGVEEYRVSLPNPQLPLNVQLSIAAVIAHQGTSLQEDIQAWEEKRVVSKHAMNLKQLDNGVKIPPRGWKCALCDLTQNLWLNLTDGTILCGRRYFDGTGGNNHAVEYFQQTGYPLAVKLGTITSEGGDVFSYDEDNMVEDPKLQEHLKHFGIDISLLEKTDKTMTELEIEANLSLKAEWDTIQESGKKLQPLFGPGYTGMMNLGNSCYMNSVMQVLFKTYEFQQRYYNNATNIFETSTKDAPVDFNVQMAKLATGLLSGIYSEKPENDCPESLGVRPQMLKNLIGRGHPEFSTNHQQDALEYFLHVLDLLEKNETNVPDKLRNNFTFQLEDRIECSSSHKVQYIKREETSVGIPINLKHATNQDEYDNFKKRREEAEKNQEKIDPASIVRLNIPFDACLQQLFGTEEIKDYYSTAVKAKTTANKHTRFASFPEYLVLQLRKFTVSEDWSPTKLDVSVNVPEEIDLTSFKSSGLQPNEELLPEDSQAKENQEPEINEEYVGQLVDMGFPFEGCRKAVYFTKNQGVEAAMNWVFEHSQDADFAEPLQLQQISKKSSNEPAANPESIMLIVSMGFTEEQAKIALKKTLSVAFSRKKELHKTLMSKIRKKDTSQDVDVKNQQNNVEAAAEWILTHLDDLNSMDVDEPQETSSNNETSSKNYKDGIGKYSLFAFISHMGTSTSCGHYVCHIKSEGRWVIYNDRKVAVSENPPKDLGYLYFFKRNTDSS